MLPVGRTFLSVGGQGRTGMSVLQGSRGPSVVFIFAAILAFLLRRSAAVIVLVFILILVLIILAAQCGFRSILVDAAWVVEAGHERHAHGHGEKIEHEQRIGATPGTGVDHNPPSDTRHTGSN